MISVCIIIIAVQFATAGQDFVVTQSRLHEMLSKTDVEVYTSSVTTYIFEGLV